MAQQYNANPEVGNKTKKLRGADEQRTVQRKAKEGTKSGISKGITTHSRQNVTRRDLIVQIRENMAEVNRRVLEIVQEEIDTGISSQFLKNQRHKFAAITKTKGSTKGKLVNRIATGSLTRKNKSDLQLILKAQKTFLKSKFSTAEGRREIEEKAFKTLTTGEESLPGFRTMSRDAYTIFRRIMGSTEVMGELREKYGWNSEQVRQISEEAPSMKDEIWLAARLMREYENAHPKANLTSPQALKVLVKLANEKEIANLNDADNLDHMLKKVEDLYTQQ